MPSILGIDFLKKSKLSLHYFPSDDLASKEPPVRDRMENSDILELE